jgi:hypothetical protein
MKNSFYLGIYLRNPVSHFCIQNCHTHTGHSECGLGIVSSKVSRGAGLKVQCRCCYIWFSKCVYKRYQFKCTNVHFDKLSLFSDAQAENVGNSNNIRKLINQNTVPWKRADSFENNVFIFEFSRTTGPILSRLGTNYPWEGGIQVCLNDGGTLLSKGR